MFMMTHNVMEDRHVGCIGDVDFDECWRAHIHCGGGHFWLGNILDAERRRRMTFKEWWLNEGSQAPYTHHDCEEHTMRMCEIAWSNGAYKERERICKQIAVLHDSLSLASNAAIRARGEA
jgi:hypothetical protein